jgi:hypothetical protein
MKIQGVKGTLLDFFNYIRTKMYVNASIIALSRNNNLSDVAISCPWGPTK